MFIPTPKIVDQYIFNIPKGKFNDVKSLRKEMAKDFNAEMSCPMVTGIALRIVSEASYEEYNAGIDLNAITPFWRMVNPNSKLAGKLACGIDFIAERHTQENIVL